MDGRRYYSEVRFEFFLELISLFSLFFTKEDHETVVVACSVINALIKMTSDEKRDETFATTRTRTI